VSTLKKTEIHCLTIQRQTSLPLNNIPYHLRQLQLCKQGMKQKDLVAFCQCCRNLAEGCFREVTGVELYNAYNFPNNYNCFRFQASLIPRLTHMHANKNSEKGGKPGIFCHVRIVTDN